MNERDYLIIESAVISTGLMLSMVFIILFFLLEMGMVLVLVGSIIAFTTFFIGLYCHFKRRLIVLMFKEEDE